MGILCNVTEWMKIAGPNYCVLILTIFSHSRQLVFHMLKNVHYCVINIRRVEL